MLAHLNPQALGPPGALQRRQPCRQPRRLVRVQPLRSAPRTSAAEVEGSVSETEESVFVPEAPAAFRHAPAESGAGAQGSAAAAAAAAPGPAGPHSQLGADGEEEEEGIHIFPEAPNVFISDRGPVPDALSSFDDGAGFFVPPQYGSEDEGSMSSYEDLMGAAFAEGREGSTPPRPKITCFDPLGSYDGMAGNYFLEGQGPTLGVQAHADAEVQPESPVSEAGEGGGASDIEGS